MAFEALEAMPAEAAQERLRKCAAVGGYAPAELTQGGQAFLLKTTSGTGVFVLAREGDVCWISAGEGAAQEDLTATGLALIEEIARQAGCVSVGFKTRRPGLVRKAKGLGYGVDQIHMKKVL